MATDNDMRAENRPAARQPAVRSGTRFASDDPIELARRLEASDCFCRDTRLGRLYHRNRVSYREIATADSLHVTVRQNGEVSTHVDRHSPLARRQPGGDCRYSPLRIAAHNVSGMANDLLRLALGRGRLRQGETGDGPAGPGLIDDAAIHAALALREQTGNTTATLPLTAIDVAVRRSPSGQGWTIRLEAWVDGEVDHQRLAAAIAGAAGDDAARPNVDVCRVRRPDGADVVLLVEDADDDGRVALALLSDICRAYEALPDVTSVVP